MIKFRTEDEILKHPDKIQVLFKIKQSLVDSILGRSPVIRIKSMEMYNEGGVGLTYTETKKFEHLTEEDILTLLSGAECINIRDRQFKKEKDVAGPFADGNYCPPARCIVYQKIQ